jgi:hypothetical protein
MRGKQVQQMARKFIWSVRTIYPIVGTQERTLTRQSAIPFLVRMQNSDLRGLGTTHRTDSIGRLGRAGTVDSCLAADVGKYMY